MGKTVGILAPGIEAGALVVAEARIFGRHVIVHGKAVGKAPGRPWNGPRIILDLGPNEQGTRVHVTTGDVWRVLPDVAAVVTSERSVTDWDTAVQYVEAWRGWTKVFDSKVEEMGKVAPWSVLAKSGANWKSSLVSFRTRMEKPEFHDPIYIERWDELLAYLGGLDYLAAIGRSCH